MSARVRTMRALTGYLLVDALRCQRVLIPVLLYAAVLGVLFANDHGGAPGPWSASALALYAATAWMSVTAVNSEEPIARSVIVAAAGGPGPILVATVAATLALEVPLITASVAVPAALDPTGFPPAALLDALIAHAAVAITGTAVGLGLAAPVVSRAGWSFVLTALVVMITATQPRLPPVGTVIAALSTSAPARLPLALDLAVAVGVLGAVAVLRWEVQRRR